MMLISQTEVCTRDVSRATVLDDAGGAHVRERRRGDHHPGVDEDQP